MSEVHGDEVDGEREHDDATWPRVVAIHEAGHAVMAFLLGAKIDVATVVPTEEAGGRVEAKAKRAGTRAMDLLVEMSGPAAEFLEFGFLNGGEDEDFRYARQHLDVGARLALFEGAVTLLRAHWPAVEAVATALHEWQTLSDSDVRKAIRGKVDPTRSAEKWKPLPDLQALRFREATRRHPNTDEARR